MNITRTAQMVAGKLVYTPPFTAAEEAHNKKLFEEICYTKQAPGTQGTDRAFLEGHHNHGFDREPEWMQYMILNKAKMAGVQTQGKVYKGGLADARGPADPRAWVSDTHDVKKVCEERNYDCRGAVTAKGELVERPPDVPLAEKLIEGITADYLEKDPDLKRKPKQEVREMVIATHGTPAKFKGPSKLKGKR